MSSFVLFFWGGGVGRAVFYCFCWSANDFLVLINFPIDIFAYTRLRKFLSGLSWPRRSFESYDSRRTRSYAPSKQSAHRRAQWRRALRQNCISGHFAPRILPKTRAVVAARRLDTAIHLFVGWRPVQVCCNSVLTASVNSFCVRTPCPVCC